MLSLTRRESAGKPGPSTHADCMNESTRLLGPDGQELAGPFSCGVIEATPLPVTGTHTVEVGMTDASAAGLSVHDVSP